MAIHSYVVRKLICPKCGHEANELIDVTPGAKPARCTVKKGRKTCDAILERPEAEAPKSPTVVDDVLWGGPQFVHNITTEPIWVETKTQYNELLAAHGMRQKVRHVPVPGTDKSPITTSWNIGVPKDHDPRPFCMLSPDEQQERRRTEAKRLGFSTRELRRIGKPTATSKIEGVQEPAPACEFYPD